MSQEHFAFFDDQASGRHLYFKSPRRTITASTPQEIETAFTKIEAALANGFWIAGYLSYEAGLALETKLVNGVKHNEPLLRFGVFDAPEDAVPIDKLYTANPPELSLQPSWTESDYLSRFETLKNYIEAGDCYQVNLTFPMTAKTDASAAEVFAVIDGGNPGDTGRYSRLAGQRS